MSLFDSSPVQNTSSTSIGPSSIGTNCNARITSCQEPLAYKVNCSGVSWLVSSAAPGQQIFCLLEQNALPVIKLFRTGEPQAFLHETRTEDIMVGHDPSIQQ